MDFWGIRGHYAEARQRLEPALRVDTTPTRARARALAHASDAALAAGDQVIARERAEESLALHRELGDAWGETYATFLLADVAANERDWAAGRDLFEWCGVRFGDLGDEQHALWSARMLGWMHEELGDRSRAREIHEDNLRRARASGNETIVAASLEALAHIDVAEGQPLAAAALLEEAFAIHSALEDVFRLGVILVRFAVVLSTQRLARDAVRCLASAEVLLEESGGSPPWVEQMKNDARARIEDLLDATSTAEAWEEGTKLTPEKGVALALAALGRSRETN
jgi:tetratricopeptide (TPR) repeat protein